MLTDYKTTGKTAAELQEDIMEMADKMKKEIVAELEDALDNYFQGKVMRGNVGYHMDLVSDYLYALDATLNAYDSAAIEEAKV